jgi:AraC-like DNA-binding protein
MCRWAAATSAVTSTPWACAIEVARPISPITAATVVPTGVAEPVVAATTPTHSIPSTRGNRTAGGCPCRVRNSDRFRPAPILDDPADSSPLAVLGRRTGAGARTLSRLFADELGMTFSEWRTELRVCHALVLLAQGHDTTRVAHACGWANPSGFITAFTAIVGTTPGRHRQLYRSRSRYPSTGADPEPAQRT